MIGQTLYDKIWREHLVDEQPGGACLLYVDRHIVHEVDSPQAFGGLRRAGLAVRAPEKTLLVVDHNVPTSAAASPTRILRARRRSPISLKTPGCLASNITTSSTSGRVSATSSDRSRALRCRARPSFAATATLPPTAPSAR
jgi:homoaconitase/3-isopropylmalate dehydratase large subunit